MSHGHQNLLGEGTRMTVSRSALESSDESGAPRDAGVRPRSMLELRGDPCILRLTHQLPVCPRNVAISMLQGRQRFCLGQPGSSLAAAIRVVAAPRIVLRRVAQPSRHRHYMQVPKQRKQVEVGVDDDRSVSGLIDRPGSPPLSMQVSRVRSAYASHQRLQGHIGQSYYEVRRIRQPAVREKPPAAPHECATDQRLKPLAVALLGEKRRVLVASNNHIDNAARNIDSIVMSHSSGPPTLHSAIL
jgi:hypothetical protein